MVSVIKSSYILIFYLHVCACYVTAKIYNTANTAMLLVNIHVIV